MERSANPVLIHLFLLLTIIFGLSFYFDPDPMLIFFYGLTIFVCFFIDKKALTFTGNIRDYSKILVLFCVSTPLILLGFTALNAESSNIEFEL